MHTEAILCFCVVVLLPCCVYRLCGGRGKRNLTPGHKTQNTKQKQQRSRKKKECLITPKYSDWIPVSMPCHVPHHAWLLITVVAFVAHADQFQCWITYMMETSISASGLDTCDTTSTVPITVYHEGQKSTYRSTPVSCVI